MLPENFNFDLIKAQIVAAIAQYGGKILLAILVLIIGRFLISKITHLVSQALDKRKVDRDVQPFLNSLVNVMLNIMLLLSIAGILGIQTTSFVAVLGAASLAVGFALQGSLANFAGGVLILIFKPYRVGDLISAQGFTGVVEAIQIFNTILVTVDNKTIILPNGALSTSPITNISGKGKIRVDMVFAAGSQNGVDAIRAAIRKVVDICPTALKNVEHDILVTKLTENAIFFDVRVWTPSDTFWDTYYYINEGISKQYALDGIGAPQPALLNVALKQ
ncbi:Small-conductance mechanosensitive channel [Dyadobacter sp. CECT 9275]|uniref:Small-conductance mechanosensitive channel n=1 Tax=Dyadobacter helix TaxID=2822344 RepID=A0A916NMQ8_9BACT|nr:mechanosensitive ion channel domain-containing protein [Dyadobacter sp. CECT 9275]CAG5008140.1 Small-conductance mechanosensitive channel [Dyadobacter sp. CECT 9275]